MKIRTKLLITLMPLPILLLIFIGLGWLQVASLEENKTSLQENYELSLIGEQINRDVKDEGIILRNLVIYTDESTIQNEINKLQIETEEISKNIVILEERVDSQEQIEVITKLKEVNKKFNSYKDEILTLIDQGRKNDAILLINEKSMDLHQEFYSVTKDLTFSFETNFESSLIEIIDDFQSDTLLTISLLAAVIIIIILLLFWTMFSLSKRLKRVSSVMNEIADGEEDLQTKVGISSADEISDVAKAFNKMTTTLAEQIEKDQQLTWIKSNIADITTSLSNSPDLDTLGRTFLSKLVPLVEASHAVFYVKDVSNQDSVNYSLLASYAFKERKHVSNRIQPGEGLLGQAIVEKSAIILSDVPSDYVQISSGLGKATPLTLYILPIVFEDDVIAVFELASFTKFNETQQIFLEEVTNNVGIILENLMGKLRLSVLLEESQTLMEEIQAQSEELQAQQEELRATNEELEEQTDALRQSEEKLQAQQEELEQTNVELEEKAKNLEEQNKRFEQTNREVEKARAELEEKAYQLSLASKYKSEFLANMSHELRTPLNSLLILSKLLADNKEGNLSPKQVEFSNTIYSSGNDLLSLINDILDLAKIESGKMEVYVDKVEISDLVSFVEANYRSIANGKGLDFSINVKDNVPKYITSDETRIQQVLHNLLSNAFKFTHEGSVTLEVSTIPSNKGTSKLSFSVIDTGIGIPKEKLDSIFQAFQQADGTTSRKYGGTGLGLTISRENAALLGGEVIVTSAETRGSTFTFLVGDYEGTADRDVVVIDEAAVTLERVPNENKSASGKSSTDYRLPAQEENSHIKRLLIVDDDKNQRTSLMELIGDMDVIIKAVSTGKEALEELKVNKYDCVILDLGLTDTTGFVLLEKIEQIESTIIGKIIIYTGRDITLREEAHLTKFAHTIIIKDQHSPQRLKDELELYFNCDSEETVYTDLDYVVEADTILKDKKILLVDDDVRNVYALSSILELYGMEVHFAENGLEALELVKSESNFDLVLMDIMMPEMDGYECIQKIRKLPQFETLPIIALTAKAMKGDREKCLEVGASDYIGKPVEPDKLISLIKVWLYQGRN
ncbi:response regulator [Ferdinandcohnia sp. Marseille-Q9671]